MTTRFATNQDAGNKIKFCVIRVEVSRGGILIEHTGDIVPRQIGKERVYRFGPLGAIDWVELGEVRMQSCGEYGFTGHIIDYAGNREDCLNTARAFVEEKRTQYVKRLNEHAAAMLSQNVVVQ